MSLDTWFPNEEGEDSGEFNNDLGILTSQEELERLIWILTATFSKKASDENIALIKLIVNVIRYSPALHSAAEATSKQYIEKRLQRLTPGQAADERLKLHTERRKHQFSKPRRERLQNLRLIEPTPIPSEAEVRAALDQLLYGDEGSL